eukprot:s2439_g9.t1
MNASGEYESDPDPAANGVDDEQQLLDELPKLVQRQPKKLLQELKALVAKFSRTEAEKKHWNGASMQPQNDWVTVVHGKPDKATNAEKRPAVNQQLPGKLRADDWNAKIAQVETEKEVVLAPVKTENAADMWAFSKALPTAKATLVLPESFPVHELSTSLDPQAAMRECLCGCEEHLCNRKFVCSKMRRNLTGRKCQIVSGVLRVDLRAVPALLRASGQRHQLHRWYFEPLRFDAPLSKPFDKLLETHCVQDVTLTIEQQPKLKNKQLCLTWVVDLVYEMWVCGRFLLQAIRPGLVFGKSPGYPALWGWKTLKMCSHLQVFLNLNLWKNSVGDNSLELLSKLCGLTTKILTVKYDGDTPIEVCTQGRRQQQRCVTMPLPGERRVHFAHLTKYADSYSRHWDGCHPKQGDHVMQDRKSDQYLEEVGQAQAWGSALEVTAFPIRKTDPSMFFLREMMWRSACAAETKEQPAVVGAVPFLETEVGASLVPATSVSGWQHDLVEDGHVESNPGPSSSSSCAFCINTRGREGAYRALDLIAVNKPHMITLQETTMDEEESRQFSRIAAARGYRAWHVTRPSRVDAENRVH